MSNLEIFFSGHTNCRYFSPPRWAGGAESKRTMPVQRNWTITNQHRNKHDNYNIRRRKRPLQRQETNAEQADHGAAKTTLHQQKHCSSHDMTIDRPQASQPTPN